MIVQLYDCVILLGNHQQPVHIFPGGRPEPWVHSVRPKFKAAKQTRRAFSGLSNVKNVFLNVHIHRRSVLACGPKKSMMSTKLHVILILLGADKRNSSTTEICQTLPCHLEFIPSLKDCFRITCLLSFFFASCTASGLLFLICCH